MSTMTPVTRLFKIVIIMIFFITIAVPLVGYFLSDRKQISMVEKRVLASRPLMPSNLKSLKKFPASIEQYYNDHFGFRDQLLAWYAKGKIMIGDSPGVNRNDGAVSVENVLQGKEGWFFLNMVWDGDPLSDYRNIDLYSQARLDEAVLKFAARRHWLAQQGIQYLLVIAPNKHTIYSEYLPDYITKRGDISAMDQLKEALEWYTAVQFVDLRDVLIRSKENAHLYWGGDREEGRLYWKNDSHWNGAGIDVVQYEIARHLRGMFPGVIEPTRRSKTDFFLKEITGDLARLMNRENLKEKGPVVLEGFCSQRSLEKPRKMKQAARCSTGKLNAIIVHDSFMTLDLKRYLADYFRETQFFWKGISQEILQQNIERLKPAVVIEEFAERFLPYVPDLKGERHDDFLRGLFYRSSKVLYRMNWQKAAGEEGGYKYQNIKAGAVGRADVLRLTALGKDPQLYLPEIDFKASGFYVLKVDITPPTDTIAEIFFSRRGKEDLFPASADSWQFKIRRGVNSLYIPLLLPNLGYRLRFDPGKVAGDYTVRAFEVREVGPSLIQ